MPDSGGSGGTGGSSGGGLVTGYPPVQPEAPFRWRSLFRWLVGGFGRVGRGVELAAAGVLVTGAAMTWQLSSPIAAKQEGAHPAAPPAHACCCAGRTADAAEAAGAGAHCSREAPPTEIVREPPAAADALNVPTGHHGDERESGSVRRPGEGGVVVTI